MIFKSEPTPVSQTKQPEAKGLAMQKREEEQRECVMTEGCDKSPLPVDINDLNLDINAFPELCCEGRLAGLPRMYLPIETAVIPPKWPMLGNWTVSSCKDFHGYICEGPFETIRNPNVTYKQEVTAETTATSDQETLKPLSVKLMVDIYAWIVFTMY